MRMASYFSQLAGMLALLCLLLFFGTTPAHAAQTGGQRTVRVGYSGYDGFLTKDQDGEYSGYMCEYLERIAGDTGWDYQYVYGTWAENLERLERGEIDLLCSAHYTAELARHYDYSRREIGIEFGALYVPRENTAISYEDFNAFHGLRVGFLKDRGQSTTFRSYAIHNSFDYQPSFYDTVSDLNRALAENEVDAVVTGSLRRTGNEKIVARFGPEPFYFITRKGNEELMRSVDEAMDRIYLDNVNYSNSLYQKYYGGSGIYQLAFTKEEMLYLRNHPVMNVAYDTGWQPVEYRDPDTGKPRGISVDILQMVSRMSGLNFQMLPVREHDESIKMLREGKADLLCGHFQAINSENTHDFILTEPYVDVPVALAARTGTALTPQMSIAVPRACVGLSYYARQQYPGADVTVYANVEECLDAVSEGREDAVFENVYLLKQHLQNPIYAGIEMLSETRTAFSLCIAISKDADPALLSILNKVILQIGPEEQMDSVVANTMADPLPTSLYTTIRRNAVPILIVVVWLFTLIVGLIGWLARRSKRQLEELAFVDALTGIFNMNRFCIEVKRLLQEKHEEKYALVEFDVDKFKTINDMYGFETGNRVLRQVAQRLAAFAEADEIYCRYSSDDFLILLRYLEDDDLIVRLDQMIAALVEAAGPEDENYQYTVSCGVYKIDDRTLPVYLYVDRANLARRAIKNDFLRPYGIYTEEMRESVLQEKEIESSMQEALEKEEFQVFYQPKCSLVNGCVVGAEALVRWKRSDGALIPPDRFIPVLEKNGFVVKLDLYVFDRVCRQLRAWIDEGIFPVPVSVNLSRMHLMNADFVLEYRDILQKYRVPSYLVELELTESVMFDNQERLISLMNLLHVQGFNISMDDFGSGYSSLNLLKDLPLDVMKLDREFFAVSSNTERGQTIISSVIRMAHQLGIVVVAEGVETEEQVRFLRAVDCDVAQGYYYSRPLTRLEFEKKVFPSL